MNLSRSEGQRKMPSLSLGRWLIVLAGFIVFVLVSAVLFVRSADSEYRSAEKQAIRIAKAQGGLAEVDEAVSHTWDETVWVVTGKDSEGTEWMIWERKDELIKKKISENISEQQMLAKFAEEHSGTPIRIIPGWFMNGPAWEVRYWNEKSQEHQSLDFFSFQDGKLLKTYVLSIQ
ncbi:cell wall elongation regulator TseB-like domain-containing protein [Cohnella herbarum]|uniref:DUF5590 domain-containing protein n=1 Tax=Cohnella herbarum TaxID=2728023 RepID=A0A7Z2ZJS1_9BACL|nr:DUF5590 domain-containing protein [Cohnella herbarum]QJD82461.1 DUF5590 domain-containing protein [Cohnella herbarum]